MIFTFPHNLLCSKNDPKKIIFSNLLKPISCVEKRPKFKLLFTDDVPLQRDAFSQITKLNSVN